LRWDSLGEFLAIAVTLEDLGRKTNNENAKILAIALDQANSLYLNNDKSPSRKIGGIDNRGSHFYIALYWAQALAEQNQNLELKSKFANLAQTLKDQECQILSELSAAQGQPVDIGGYYFADCDKASQAMRPSQTLNNAISLLN
jgi:isocitrate dehydrogenase